MYNSAKRLCMRCVHYLQVLYRSLSEQEITGQYMQLSYTERTSQWMAKEINPCFANLTAHTHIAKPFRAPIKSRRSSAEPSSAHREYTRVQRICSLKINFIVIFIAFVMAMATATATFDHNIRVEFSIVVKRTKNRSERKTYKYIFAVLLCCAVTGPRDYAVQLFLLACYTSAIKICVVFLWFFWMECMRNC